MPIASRSIQGDGLTLFHIRYWHPIFAAWRISHRNVVVRYHPEDLSRIFVSKDGKEYLEARYADLRRPPISLWEQRAALRILRAQGQPDVSERLIFAAIEKQRQIVTAAPARDQTRPPPIRRQQEAIEGDSSGRLRHSPCRPRRKSMKHLEHVGQVAV